MRGRTILDLRNLLDPKLFVNEGFVVHRVGRAAQRPRRTIPRQSSSSDETVNAAFAAE
jgi:hypothetical protein